MNLDIRMLNSSDYDDILVGWWKRWRWSTPPSKEFLPQNGEGGFIVYDGDIPVCAGFLYATNSKIAWIDWIVSNFDYKNKDGRREALILLIDTLGEAAKIEEYKYIYSLMTIPSLMELFEELGYVKGYSYTTEMIKIWD